MRPMYCSLLLLVLLCIPLISAVSYDDKNTLDSVVTIRNTFTIVPTSDSYDIKSINVTMVAFPRVDNRQTVSGITASPDAVIGDGVSYFFNDPLTNDFSVRLDASVATRNYIDEIKVPVKFPLSDLDSSFYTYLAPTQIIDVTPDIQNLASELIGDDSDLYSVEYSFAEYVRKNVAYDLSTLTANADQKSSWVLANKRGVCDEITNLFISLNRAAGIPARFVSGVSYTNLNDTFGKNWVPHAWAEVYFPGVGWVPYDVTYGQYGFIDAGHIKLLESHDSSGSDVNYNYYGHDISLQPGSVDIDVNVTGYGENVHARYSFITSLYSEQVGFGSYDLVKVDVTNTQGYYVVADLYLAETQGIMIVVDSAESILGRVIHRREVLLEPYQTKTVYWIVKIDDSLDSRYVYTFPMTVYNTYNETSTARIESKSEYITISSEYLKSLVASQEEESKKAYSKYVYLQCTPDKNSMYLEDSVNISCILDNRGDKSFDNVSICIDGKCTDQSLGIQKIPLAFNKRFSSEGLKNIEIKAYNDEFTKVSYISVNVMDRPSIVFSDMNAPESVSYGDPFEILFTIGKNSSSNPKNLNLSLVSPLSKVEWVFDGFEGQKTFNIQSNGNAMRPGANDYKILVTYEDDKGRTYSESKTFRIQSNANFFENILLYFNVIGYGIEGMFTG